MDFYKKKILRAVLEKTVFIFKAVYIYFKRSQNTWPQNTVQQPTRVTDLSLYYHCGAVMTFFTLTCISSVRAHILLAPLDCERPPALVDGDTQGTSQYRYRHGDRVRYICQNFYTLEGEPHKTCNNGKWIGQMRCISKLQFLFLVLHSMRILDR